MEVSKCPSRSVQENRFSPSPLCNELGHFMLRSKIFQEEFNDTEGQYGHRKFHPSLSSTEIQLQLRRHVGLYLYGIPDSKETNWNKETGYGFKERRQIDKMVGAILKYNKEFDALRSAPGEIHYAMIFVMVFQHSNKTTFLFPMARVVRYEGDEDPVYIDHEGNKFDSWALFKDNNSLPASLICAPRDGMYATKAYQDDQSVDLEYFPSPLCFEEPETIVQRRKRLAIKGGLIVLDVIGLAGTTALCVMVGGPMGLAARVGMGFAGASTVGHIVNLVMATKVGKDEILTSVAITANFMTTIACGSSSLLTLAGVGVLGFAATGLNVAMLGYVLYEVIEEYKKTGHITATSVVKVLTSLLSFGNSICGLVEVNRLVQSSMWSCRVSTVNLYMDQVSMVFRGSSVKVITQIVGQEICCNFMTRSSRCIAEITYPLKRILIELIQRRITLSDCLQQIRDYIMKISDKYIQLIRKLISKKGSQSAKTSTTLSITDGMEIAQTNSDRQNWVVASKNYQKIEYAKSAKPDQACSVSPRPCDFSLDIKKIQVIVNKLSAKLKMGDLASYEKLETFVYRRVFMKVIKKQPLILSKEAYDAALTEVETEVTEFHPNQDGEFSGDANQYLSSLENIIHPLCEDCIMIRGSCPEDIVKNAEKMTEAKYKLFGERIYVAQTENLYKFIVIQHIPHGKETYIGFILN